MKKLRTKANNAYIENVLLLEGLKGIRLSPDLCALSCHIASANALIRKMIDEKEFDRIEAEKKAGL